MAPALSTTTSRTGSVARISFAAPRTDSRDDMSAWTRREARLAVPAFEVRLDVPQPAGVAPDEHDARPEIGEAARDHPTEARGGPRHHGGPATERIGRRRPPIPTGAGARGCRRS